MPANKETIDKIKALRDEAGTNRLKTEPGSLDSIRLGGYYHAYNIVLQLLEERGK